MTTIFNISVLQFGQGSVFLLCTNSSCWNLPVIPSIDVYVWIEGWDGECLNAIFSQQLQVKFDFALLSSLK